MLYPTTLVDDAMNTVAGTPVFRHPSDGADPAPQGLCLPMRGPSRGRCQICNYIGSGLPLLEGLVRKPSPWILLSSATLLWVDEGPACWRGSTGVARRRRFPDSCPSEVWSSLMGRSNAKTGGERVGWCGVRCSLHHPNDISHRIELKPMREDREPWISIMMKFWVQFVGA